jgi:hypothetical protein
LIIINSKRTHVRGGKRERAGRKPGSVARIDYEARRNALTSGVTPLEYLLSIMRDESGDAHARLDAAKAAAPYCHARLSSTELSGPEKGPVQTQEVPHDVKVEALLSILRKKGLKIEGD